MPHRSLPTSFVSRFDDAVAQLARERAIDRLWEHDHTLWSPSSEEISNRLGWLDLIDLDEPMRRLDEIVAENRDEGVEHVVLLGMGGSSLGAEALAESFGAQPD